VRIRRQNRKRRQNKQDILIENLPKFTNPEVTKTKLKYCDYPRHNAGEETETVTINVNHFLRNGKLQRSTSSHCEGNGNIKAPGDISLK
jgi:hypothetical protein